MRWINAEAKIRMQIYDEEHEEYITREMTVEDALDAYTEDGCPTTVDAEPVRHGHWINDKGLYKCSVCNEFATIAGFANCIPIEQMNKAMKYCNNCGAIMDEVNDGINR